MTEKSDITLEALEIRTHLLTEDVDQLSFRITSVEKLLKKRLKNLGARVTMVEQTLKERKHAKIQ